MSGVRQDDCQAGIYGRQYLLLRRLPKISLSRFIFPAACHEIRRQAGIAAEMDVYVGSEQVVPVESLAVRPVLFFHAPGVGLFFSAG